MEDEEIYIIRAPRTQNTLGRRPNRPTTTVAYPKLFQNPTRKSPTQTGSSTTVKTPVFERRRRSRSRERVMEVLKRFRERQAEILRSGKAEDIGRVDLKAFVEMKRRLTIGKADSIGVVPGVEVGDRFEVRAELLLTGVHGRLQHGIDFATFEGKLLATCIVSKIGYYDKMNDPDFLVYGGEGGISRDTKKKKKFVLFDQKMKKGNLALKNSMESGTDVRVLRGVQDPRKKTGSVVYVYDGLYRVVDMKRKKGIGGNMVFDFYLRRNPGQKQINWKNYR